MDEINSRWMMTRKRIKRGSLCVMEMENSEAAGSSNGQGKELEPDAEAGDRWMTWQAREGE